MKDLFDIMMDSDYSRIRVEGADEPVEFEYDDEGEANISDLVELDIQKGDADDDE